MELRQMARKTKNRLKRILLLVAICGSTVVLMTTGCRVEQSEKGACFATYECKPGLFCFKGVCSNPHKLPCQKNGDCLADNACRFGSCVPKNALKSCDRNRPCEKGRCVSGYCALDGEGSECTRHGQCSSGLVCYQALCRPGTRCSVTQDCDQEDYCKNGMCVKRTGELECDSKEDCAEGEFCSDGFCEQEP